MIFVEGKNINLRLVSVSDASFILSLRVNPSLNKHLSYVEEDLRAQEKWIANSLKSKTEHYFVIENKEKKQAGTIRLYNIENKQFCWGSWIVQPEHRKYSSFESAYLLYSYAFSNLGLNSSKFDVRIDNKIVINFHKKFGAKIVDVDEINTYFEYTKDDFLLHKKNYEIVIDKLYKLKNES
jgi:RimJ/RimL family protein N-acetyltransferase